MGAKGQGADATSGRWLAIPRTLCFVFNGDDVLLMKRAPHRRVFPNRYNGVGGHIERHEDPLTGALREINEETDLNIRDVRFSGAYNIDAGAATGIVLFIFSAISDSRHLKPDSPEGTLHWIPVDQTGDIDLVEDLPHILPRVIEGYRNPEQAPFFAHVSYDADDNIVLLFAGEGNST